jgi:hypothetical protein
MSCADSYSLTARPGSGAGKASAPWPNTAPKQHSDLRSRPRGAALAILK